MIRISPFFALAIPSAPAGAFLSAGAEIVDADCSLHTPIRDPNDVPVLHAAISGRVEFLCTLDEHFKTDAIVSFASARGITIIDDLDFMRRLRRTQ